MGGNFLLGLLLLSVTLVRAQEYVVWEDPEFDIWDESKIDEEKLLLNLCQNYEITINNNQIDCSNIQLSPKNFETLDDSHVIQKREADTDDLQGSGDGESGTREHNLEENPVEGTNSTSVDDQVEKGNVDIQLAAVNASEVANAAEDSDSLSQSEKENKPDSTANEALPVMEETSLDINASENNTSVVEPQIPVVDQAEAKDDRVKNGLEAESKNLEESLMEQSEVKSEKAPDETSPVETDAQEESTGDQSEAENPAVEETQQELINNNQNSGVPVNNTIRPSLQDSESSEIAQVQEPDNVQEEPAVNQTEEVPAVDEKQEESIGQVFDIAANEKEKNLVVEDKVDDNPNPEPAIGLETSDGEKAPNNTQEVFAIKQTEEEAPPAEEKQEGQVIGTVINETENKDSQSSNNETEPTEKAEIQPKLKEPEVIDDKQSGNAVLFKQTKNIGSSGVEGSETDKQLASLATNEDLKSQSDNSEPNTGESSKNVSKAGKDTTILIVLFVVVLIIGGAAFTHHMIKMRKAKKAENSHVEDGVTGISIRRSLQNNENGKSTDVEEGTEMKPLMNNGPAVMVKEYTDTKKEVQA